MDHTRYHLSSEELNQGLDSIRNSPKSVGTVEMIVIRPREDARKILDEGMLDLSEGLVGDNWSTKGSSKTEDGSSHPEMQLNLMNARTVQLIAGDKSRWPLAGDQFFVDLDLSKENLPAGTQLKIGEAVIEVTPMPHLGCKKFVARFGLPAMQFVNSAKGKELNLRGLNARVITAGKVRTGDTIEKIS